MSPGMFWIQMLLSMYFESKYATVVTSDPTPVSGTLQAMGAVLRQYNLY